MSLSQDRYLQLLFVKLHKKGGFPVSFHHKSAACIMVAILA
jgi:hypothetical protein